MSNTDTYQNPFATYAASLAGEYRGLCALVEIYSEGVSSKQGKVFRKEVPKQLNRCAGFLEQLSTRVERFTPEESVLSGRPGIAQGVNDLLNDEIPWARPNDKYLQTVLRDMEQQLEIQWEKFKESEAYTRYEMFVESIIKDAITSARSTGTELA